MRISGSRPGQRQPWRALVLVLVLVAPIVGFYAIAPEAAVNRIHTRALAREWLGCARGRPPGLQPDIERAYARHLKGGKPVEVQVVEADQLPSLEIAAPSLPLPVGHPDRPDGRTITVAVIDSGVASRHPALAETEVLRGVDLVNPCGDGRQDVSGHGTAVTGLIAAAASPGASLRILPARVSMATGKHSRTGVALAVMWATRQGADVINLSLASPRPSRLERAAVRYAHRRGVVIVAAAGNHPAGPAEYPAAYPEVMSVTAVDGAGQLSAFAARTEDVDFAAPGSRLLILTPDGSFSTASGTSLAAPVVAGSIASLLSVAPHLDGAGAVASLRRTARVPEFWGDAVLTGRDPVFGLVDPQAAMVDVCESLPWCESTLGAPPAPPVAGRALAR